ncbi:hypothetical protein [Natrinema ejinorense]|uniref:Uncharacterized protein n=1 Tax=Natrinema ejinorense TaxID=373386 RepID=A0A2A5QZS7_9EURY|nr:hypothetical protein [Natrinema ejinorense]PCR92355.1 hypothetical protein CP557_18595 [Natrinema ejinorense]
MVYARKRDRYVSRSTWFALSQSTLQLVTTITLLSLTTSLLAVSMGAPDDVAVIALAAVGAIALGLAFVRLFGFLEANGIPLLESEPASTT